MQICFLAALRAQMQRQRPRIDSGEAGLAVTLHDRGQLLAGTPVRGGIEFLYDQAVEEEAPRLHILLRAAVIADLRGRERHELARVGRVGNDLLISGHAGIEHGFARAVVQVAERAAVKDRTVGEREKCFAFALLFPQILIFVHVSMLFPDCFP